MTKSISIMGQVASYHDIARQKYFSDQTTILPRGSFVEVFKDIKADQSDFGISAIENSLYGSINQVYDLLLSEDCHIVGEIYLQIHHCLIGQNDAQITDIEEVYSQEIAIAQCADWLEQNLPSAKIIDTNDTAGSVELIKKSGLKSQAAIASEQAAKLHELKILQKGIETNKLNYTRFIVMSKSAKFDDKANKTSIILTAANKPGSLYEVLGIFNDKKINLTKLESRPITGKPWQYMFYLDFEAGAQEARTIELIKELDAGGHDVRLLGTYLAANMPIDR